MAVIIAVEEAWATGWHRIWIKSDSLSLVSCLNAAQFSPPVQLSDSTSENGGLYLSHFS